MAAEHEHSHELDEEELAVAAKVPSEGVAEVILEFLADGGIKATASGGTAGSLGVAALGQVRILVHPDDLTRARQIITEASHLGEKIDWSQVDVGDPTEE